MADYSISPDYQPMDSSNLTEELKRYVSPVNPQIFPLLATLLLAIGIFFTTWFFVYEVSNSKETRKLKKEIALSIVASVFSGFGVMFLLLAVGIYV